MTDQPPEDLRKLIADLGKLTASAHVLVACAFLEGQLQEAVASRFRTDLSNRMNERLFEGYGSLSSFSAKIDIAFALSLIDETARQDFHALREIRNAFAHPKKGALAIDDASLDALFSKLAGSREGRSKQQWFDAKVEECAKALSPAISDRYLAMALHRYAAAGLSPLAGISQLPRQPRPDPE